MHPLLSPDHHSTAFASYGTNRLRDEDLDFGHLSHRLGHRRDHRNAQRGTRRKHLANGLRRAIRDGKCRVSVFRILNYARSGCAAKHRAVLLYGLRLRATHDLEPYPRAITRPKIAIGNRIAVALVLDSDRRTAPQAGAEYLLRDRLDERLCHKR